MGAMISLLPNYLYSQLIFKPKYSNVNLSGQTIIVTGANAGLGFEAAQHFARQDAKVILAVRDESRGKDAKKKIVQKLGTDPTRLEVWKLDLSDTASVIAFADRAKQLDRIDAIVENAAVLTTKWKTIDGIESQIKINLFSTVLLALLLLPKLQESGRTHEKETHLVFVGTDLRVIAAVREKDSKGEKLFDVLNSKEDANSFDRYDRKNWDSCQTNKRRRYPTTKILLMFACQQLAERWPISEASPVIVNYCNPGMCKTTIFRDEVSWFMRKGIEVGTTILARSGEVGSRIQVNSVTLHGKESHGGYITNDSSGPPPCIEKEWGIQIQTRLWNELTEKLEAIVPGISKYAQG